jgi:hypothetical protein
MQVLKFFLFNTRVAALKTVLETITLDTKKTYMYYIKVVYVYTRKAYMYLIKVGQGFNNRMLVNGILITTGVKI